MFVIHSVQTLIAHLEDYLFYKAKKTVDEPSHIINPIEPIEFVHEQLYRDYALNIPVQDHKNLDEIFAQPIIAQYQIPNEFQTSALKNYNWKQWLELNDETLKEKIKSYYSHLPLNKLKLLAMVRLHHALCHLVNEANDALLQKDAIHQQNHQFTQLLSKLKIKIDQFDDHNNLDVPIGFKLVKSKYNQLIKDLNQTSQPITDINDLIPNYPEQCHTLQDVKAKIAAGILNKIFNENLEKFEDQRQAYQQYQDALSKHDELEQNYIARWDEHGKHQLASISTSVIDSEHKKKQTKKNKDTLNKSEVLSSPLKEIDELATLYKEAKTSLNEAKAQLEAANKTLFNALKVNSKSFSEQCKSLARDYYNDLKLNQLVEIDNAPIESELLDNVKLQLQKSMRFLESLRNERTTLIFSASLTHRPSEGESEGQINSMQMILKEAELFINKVNIYDHSELQLESMEDKLYIKIAKKGLEYILMNVQNQANHTRTVGNWTDYYYNPSKIFMNHVSRLVYDPELAAKKRTIATDMISEYKLIRDQVQTDETFLRAFLDALNRYYRLIMQENYSCSINKQTILTFVEEIQALINETSEPQRLRRAELRPH